MGASLSLTVTESNVSQANNTSVVKAVLKITASGATHNGYNQYGYIMIDGTKYTFNHSFGQNTTTTLATKSKTVTHNADGSKSVTVVGYYQTGVSPGNLSKSLTKTLTKITRQYAVTYNANGGSGSPGNQTKTYGQTLKLSTAVPTRSGYRFTGWRGSDGTNYAAGANYTGNAALTLTAQWQVITYSVTFNANGGSGAPSAQTKTHGTTLKLSNTVPTRSGYTFVGWGTSASASSASYQPGGNYTGNAAIVLYAIWSLDYTPPTINSVEVYRCKSNGDKALSGQYTAMTFTWTTGLTPGVSTYSTKIKVTYGSGTEWLAETTSTDKSATVTLGPTLIDYAPGLTATITLTDTKASTDNVAVRTVAMPNVGLAVDISPNEDNVTLFGVCDDTKSGLIVNGNIEGKNVNANGVYADNIGTCYVATGNCTIPTANTIAIGPGVTLPPGTYIMTAWWSVNSAGHGAGNHFLQVAIGTGNTPSSFASQQHERIWAPADGYMRINVTTIKQVYSQTTFYVSGVDGSYAHTSAAYCGIQAVRIR